MAGEVRVSCVLEDHSLLVHVADTGPGLSPQQQARLFVPFERLEADAQQIEGTGIGLALSKRLMALMGGALAWKANRMWAARFGCSWFVPQTMFCVGADAVPSLATGLRR